MEKTMMLLATDLDGTFLGGSLSKKRKLYRLIRNQSAIQLVFVTGRGIETVLPLLHDPTIPIPHYIISDVGATVVDGLTLEPIAAIQSDIEQRWPAEHLLKQQLTSSPGIQLQEVPQQRRCSFYYDDGVDLEAVREIAGRHQCDVLLSAGKYLDILPGGVNKGTTLKKLIKAIGFPEDHVLVAG